MYEYSRVNVKSELSVAQLLRLRSYIAFIYLIISVNLT